MDSSFSKAPVNVPKLSGFDKSHQNLLTTKCGTITPILIDELIPGSKVNCKLALSASLPPLASDTFMRCSVKCEAFFVPFRLLCGSFESWFTDEPKSFAGTSTTYIDRKGLLPTFGLAADATDSGAFVAKMGDGSLSDYLGFKLDGGAISAGLFTSIRLSAMPYLCYHKVFSDWYRNSLVQREAFLPPSYGGTGFPSPSLAPVYAGCSPYVFFPDTGGIIDSHGNWRTVALCTLADGVNLLDLRQRNFGLDYFTTGTPSPQQGSASTVSFSTSGATGQFSIAALRAANSMQQFKERNNIAGNQYVEQLYARYGVRPSDGIAQRSLFLGRADFEVYSKGIYQNSNGVGPFANNPFSTVGAQYGDARAAGVEFIVSGFEAKEPGYLLINATLVPRVTYSSGIHRRLTHYVGSGSLSDLANPILQNVGPQPIYEYELNGAISASNNAIFGYTDRFAEFKTMEDELHGILRDGNSLQSFALQRSFDPANTYQISDSFLQIPTDYMDQVTATTADISTYGCWIDCYFDYKVAQPLAKYALPTLQDPAYEHGKTIVVNRGGFRL